MEEGWGETRPDSLATQRVGAMVQRIPTRWRGTVERILGRWIGRTLIRTSDSFIRLEDFDRSMTIAAQFFTSVLPILILTATWAYSGNPDAVSDLVGVPEKSRPLIDQAVQGAGTAAFGIVGALFVLASSTSLSRALTRAFSAIWRVPRPRSGIGAVWRWVAVVLVLTMTVIFGNTLSNRTGVLPPREFWPVAASFVTDLLVATFVPWVLLSGRVRARVLLPGSVVFSLVMLAVRPATAVWMPRALEESAARYGSIGIAFTYLAYLYVASFIFLSAALVGQVLASDSGRLGAFIRDDEPALHDESAAG
jgi:membrane protein